MLYKNLESDLKYIKDHSGKVVYNKELIQKLGHKPSPKLVQWGLLRQVVSETDPQFKKWLICGNISDIYDFVEQKRRELQAVKAEAARKSSSIKKWRQEKDFLFRLRSR